MQGGHGAHVRSSHLLLSHLQGQQVAQVTRPGCGPLQVMCSRITFFRIKRWGNACSRLHRLSTYESTASVNLFAKRQALASCNQTCCHNHAGQAQPSPAQPTSHYEPLLVCRTPVSHAVSAQTDAPKLIYVVSRLLNLCSGQLCCGKCCAVSRPVLHHEINQPHNAMCPTERY